MKDSGIRILFLFALWIIPASSSNAKSISDDAGTSTAQFLKLEMGARHIALGGTYAGYGSDVFSLWGQPAALAVAPAAWQIGAQHTELFQGIDQQYVGLTGPLGSGRWGLTVNTVGVDDLLRTTESAGGTLVSTGGEFGSRDIAVGLHYGRKFGDDLAVGGAVKYLSSEIDDVNATSFSVDIGAQLAVSRIPGFTVGASVTNIGPGLKFIQVRDDLPTGFRLGGAYDLSVKTSFPVQISADILKFNDRDYDAGAGIEWKPLDFLALRGGYRSQGDDVGEGATAGLGFKFGGLTIDYAYVPFGDLGDAHRISGGYLFGGGRADVGIGSAAPPKPAAVAPVPAPARQSGSPRDRVDIKPLRSNL